MQSVCANQRKSWCNLASGDGQGTTRDSGNLSRFGSTPTISTTASCQTTATSDRSLNPLTFSLNEGLEDFWGLSDFPEATLEEVLTQRDSPRRAPNSEEIVGGLSRSNTGSLVEAIGDFFGLGGLMQDPQQVQPTPAKETPAAAGLLQQQTRQHHWPRIELEDVEVTDMPYAVYFKLRAVLPGNDWSPMSVMKSYTELKDLHLALQQTLSSGWLPDFPAPVCGAGLDDSAFLMQIGDYLACVAGNKEAVHAHLIYDFFRATDEYRERHEALWIELRPPSHVKLQEVQRLNVAPPMFGRSSFLSAPSSSNTQECKSVDVAPPMLGRSSIHSAPSSSNAQEGQSLDVAPPMFGRASNAQEGQSVEVAPPIFGMSSFHSAPSSPNAQEDQSLDVAPPMFGRSSFHSAQSSSNAQDGQSLDVAPLFGRSSFHSAPSSSNAQAKASEEQPATRDNQASAQTHSAPNTAEASSLSSPVPAPPRPRASLPSQETKPKLSSEGSDLSKSDFTKSDFTRSSAASSSSSKKSKRRRPKCVVCLAKPQMTAIDPCGHICMCQDCTAVVRECPVCRGPINKVLRVFVA